MLELNDVQSRMADKGKGRYARAANGNPTIGLAWHHTAVLYALDGATPEQEWAHIQTIEQYHIAQGWRTFGYHGIVFPSGRAYLTGDLDGARAHVASRNHELVGFCLAGRFDGDAVPSALQLAGARLLRRMFVTWYGQPRDEKGHTEWALPEYPTNCPGPRRAAWIRLIADDTWHTAPTPTQNEEEKEAVLYIRRAGAVYRVDTGFGMGPVSALDLELLKRVGREVVPTDIADVTQREFDTLTAFYAMDDADIIRS